MRTATSCASAARFWRPRAANGQWVGRDCAVRLTVVRADEEDVRATLTGRAPQQ